MQWPLWDRAVRAIHWYLPLAIAFMWWSGEEGLYEWHSWVGYSLLVAVGTRVCWGIIGSQSARFASFLATPSAVIAYARGKPHQGEGHNPLGGWATVILLLVIFLQGLSGLFVSDDVLFEGPLMFWGGEWSGVFAEWHELNWLVLQVLIVIHLLALAYHQLYRKEPLIGAMWWGKTKSRFSLSKPKNTGLALVIALIIAGLLFLLITLAPQAPSYY
jgi:cytochrome b